MILIIIQKHSQLFVNRQCIQIAKKLFKKHNNHNLLMGRSIFQLLLSQKHNLLLNALFDLIDLIDYLHIYIQIHAHNVYKNIH